MIGPWDRTESGGLVAVALTASLLLSLTGCSPEGSSPNVLLVIADTLRADRLGSYGANRNTSPMLDRFAADAVRFERAYSTAPWTQPAVATMLTGLYPSGHGMVRIRTRLAKSLPTLAEVLRDRGYATGAVVSHVFLGRKFGFARGFERFDQSEAQGHDHISSAGVTDRAIGMLREFAAEGRPFFLMAHYFDPHYTYQRHPEYGFAPPRAGRLAGGEPIVWLRRLENWTGGEVSLLRDLYDEEIRFTDAAIGRLLDALRAEDVYDETLIVFVADHGEEFMERGWLGHTRTLYEELVRVPLIVRKPGGRGAGRVVETPVSIVSLMPTVLDLIGAGSSWIAMQGESLAPLLDGADGSSAPEVFCEVDFVPWNPVYAETKTARKKAVIRDDLKLIRDELSGKLELYDLESDPGEQRDLAAEHPSMVADLQRLLEWRAALARAVTPSPAPETQLSRQEVEQLEGLGYIEPGSPPSR